MHVYESYFVSKVTRIECQLKLRKTFTLQTPLSLAGEHETRPLCLRQRREFVHRR